MPDPRPSLTDLYAAAGAVAKAGRGLPPVHLWNPDRCGEIDIVIRKDGAWVHEGTPIGRPALVRLFSTVLRRDEDGFYLVTPAERLRITVEDAPFVAVGLERAEDRLRFVTDVGDLVEAGPDHAIRVERGEDGRPRPYLHVRGGLDALISRPVFYQLVEFGEARDGRLAVASAGCWFDLGPLDA
jgi:hypothetical protein